MGCRPAGAARKEESQRAFRSTRSRARGWTADYAATGLTALLVLQLAPLALVAAALVALVSSAPQRALPQRGPPGQQPQGQQIPIISQTSEINPDGSYKWRFVQESEMKRGKR